MTDRGHGVQGPPTRVVNGISVYLPVSAVFPDEPADFDSFCSVVRSLSRTDTLFWCARINLLLSNPKAGDRIDVQRWVLARFFQHDQIDAVGAFARDHGGAERVTVFSRAQLLELFRWTCLLATDQPGDGETFSDPGVRQRFLRAALMAADIWSARTYPMGLPATGDIGNDRQAAAQAIRRALCDNATGLRHERALARGVGVYERIAEHDAAFHADFDHTAGLSLQDCLSSVCTVRVHYGNVTLANIDEQPGIFMLDTAAKDIPATAAAAIRRFVKLESHSPDALATAFLPGGTLPTPLDRFDHKPLRERPILKTIDGRAIIIDLPYFSELAVLGPIFRLAQADRGDRSRVNKLFAAFGHCFEAYVLGLLERMGARGRDLEEPDAMHCRWRCGAGRCSAAIRTGPALVRGEGSVRPRFGGAERGSRCLSGRVASQVRPGDRAAVRHSACQGRGTARADCQEHQLDGRARTGGGHPGGRETFPYLTRP